MKNFVKGIVVGIGGIAPGLSGSVLLVIFGLYEMVINSLGTLFKNFKSNIKFLVPLIMGCGVGIIAFSKIVDFMLFKYEMYTRFAFLGLILGTIPMFYTEVKKQGFNDKYYFIILLAILIGFRIFLINKPLFIGMNTNFINSFILGIIVAFSSIIPGVDSAAIMSGLGLYEIYVSSLANLNLNVLIPAFFGLVLGVLVISKVMNKLIKKYYTLTFSILFGLFLSVIPKVLNKNCFIYLDYRIIISILIMIVGFLFSYYFSRIKVKNK